MFYFFMMMGTAFVVIEAILLLFWVVYLVRRNISIIDIGWGLGFIAIALVYFLLGEGYIWRKVLMLIIISVWALRLVWHLSQRFLPDQDDPRYQLLLKKWPYVNSPTIQVLLLFVFQGVLMTILSLPFVFMSQDSLPFFTSYEVFGLLVWMGGLIGESVADSQLMIFKSNPAHVTQVYDQGLWKYSRHPNYFFEWIIWLGYFMIAFSVPWGWLSIISPILMLYLLLQGSGIPLTEEHSLKTKGNAYRDYQARTSPFFPWFSYVRRQPKKEILIEEQTLEKK